MFVSPRITHFGILIQQDFEGQHLAEQLTTNMLAISGVCIAVLTGKAVQ